MNHRFSDRSSGTFTRAIVGSLILHLLLVVVGAVMLLRDRTLEEEPEPEELEITAILESEPIAELPMETSDLDPLLVDETTREEVAELEPEPEPEEQEVQETEEVGHVVEQVTNEEMPEEAEFVSDEANRVDEETVAEETAEELAELNEDHSPEEEPVEAEVEEELAELEEDRQAAEPPPIMEEPEPELAELEPTPPVEELLPSQPAPLNELVLNEEAAPSMPQAQRDPRALFRPQAQEYAEVFDGVDELLRDTVADDPGGRKLLQHWKDNEEAMRASLENFIYHVKPGNHTGVNAHPSTYASYLARIHRRIHQRWAHGFIDHATNNLPQTHPLNNLSLNTLMELVIDARSGEVEQTNIVRSSGETTFDAEAIVTVRSLGRHPEPPQQIVSADGKVYIHWNFWRDSRQCGPFGAKIYMLNN